MAKTPHVLGHEGKRKTTTRDSLFRSSVDDLIERLKVMAEHSQQIGNENLDLLYRSVECLTQRIDVVRRAEGIRLREVR